MKYISSRIHYYANSFALTFFSLIFFNEMIQSSFSKGYFLKDLFKCILLGIAIFITWRKWLKIYFLAFDNENVYLKSLFNRSIAVPFQKIKKISRTKSTNLSGGYWYDGYELTCEDYNLTEKNYKFFLTSTRRTSLLLKTLVELISPQRKDFYFNQTLNE